MNRTDNDTGKEKEKNENEQRERKVYGKRVKILFSYFIN